MGVASEVHGEEKVLRIVRMTPNRSAVQFGAVALRRIVRRARDEVPHEPFLDVCEVRSADRHGDRIRRHPSERVVGAIDWVEDQGRVSPAVDEAGLFAQHVEASLLVLEDPKDRGLGHPVDPRAGCAVGPAAHDLGGVLDELRDRMLDRLGELEEKLLHGRPTAFLDIELTPFATRTCNWRALLVSNPRLHSADGGTKPSWWSWFSASHGVACSRSV